MTISLQKQNRKVLRLSPSHRVYEIGYAIAYLRHQMGKVSIALGICQLMIIIMLLNLFQCPILPSGISNLIIIDPQELIQLRTNCVPT